MLTTSALALRRSGITATDMTIISGVSPYGRTVHDIYLSKLGLDEPQEQTAAQSFGLRVEPIALAMLGEEYGVTIAPGTTESHPEMPWVIATPDGNVMNENLRVAVAEAKAVGLYMAKRWGESGDPNVIPDEVRVQVQWQMVTTQTKAAYVVAVLGTEARYYLIAHDDDLSAALLSLGDKFWRQNVLSRVAPAIDGTEASARMVRGLFRNSTGNIVPAPPESFELVNEYLAAKSAVDDAERRKTAAQAKLCALIGESGGIESSSWIATWKERAGSTDWKAVAEKLGATKALAEEYRRGGSRVLNVKLKGRVAA